MAPADEDDPTMPSTLPWYRRNGSAGLSHARSGLPLAARGLLASMLDAAWEDGALNLSRLHLICGCSVGEVRRFWPEIVNLPASLIPSGDEAQDDVSPMWIEPPDRPGWVICAPLERQREHIARRQAQAKAAGGVSAAKRRNSLDGVSTTVQASAPTNRPTEGGTVVPTSATTDAPTIRVDKIREDLRTPLPPKGGGGGKPARKREQGQAALVLDPSQPSPAPAEHGKALSVAKLEALLREHSAGRYVIVGGTTYGGRLGKTIASMDGRMTEAVAATLGRWYKLGEGGGNGVAFVTALDWRRLTAANLAADLAQAEAWARGARGPRTAGESNLRPQPPVRDETDEEWEARQLALRERATLEAEAAERRRGRN